MTQHHHVHNGIATLADGRKVPANSPEWRDECLRVHQHLISLRGRPLDMRRMYLADVERAEGTEARVRVALAYIADFERRKREADEALARHQAAHPVGRLQPDHH